jgi:hypothetical protein
MFTQTTDRTSHTKRISSKHKRWTLATKTLVECALCAHVTHNVFFLQSDDYVVQNFDLNSSWVLPLFSFIAEYFSLLLAGQNIMPTLILCRIKIVERSHSFIAETCLLIYLRAILETTNLPPQINDIVPLSTRKVFFMSSLVRNSFRET